MGVGTIQRSATRMLSIRTTVLLLGLAALGTQLANARQLHEGYSTFKAYRIEFNRRIIGRVVVVGAGNPNPPPGYTAGAEYWTWRPGAAWRGTFTLVPAEDAPDFDAYDWEAFAHERFDLSHTVPMPAVSPGAGDRFYRVQIASGRRWVDQGWMWLLEGPPRTQEWYGLNLAADLVGTEETAIRFTSAEPPAPGSKQVYLLLP